ncbi:hypothetical protein N431DRAFT_302329, partial [Stipitochalara longipes BDJ]
KEDNDADDDDDKISLNRKTTTLSEISFTQTFPTVTIPTSLPQTFPSVTIPTALTSTISVSTVTLGPTSVLISFPIVPFQSTIPFTSVASTSINFFSTSATIPILSTLSTRPSTSGGSTSSSQSGRSSSTSNNSLQPTPTAPVAVNEGSNTKPRLSPGSIAGIAIAILVVTLIFALLLFFLYKQFRDRKRGSSGRSDSLYEKQLISPISSPYDRRGTAFTPMVIPIAQRPAYPSDRASSEIFQNN